MDTPLVSVVIPVYKVERYLAECVDSVIGQDYPALEIILVDDGSPDSCPEICDRYAQVHPHIRAIHKSNEGLGLARNTGMEAAAGKYITFVDSDDYLDGPDAIRRLVERAEKNRADIAVGLFRRLEGRGLGEGCRHPLEDGAYTETGNFRFKGLILSDHLISAWGKLYRRAFLMDNDLRFRAYPFREDHGFNMMCYACRPVYTFVDGSVYIYRTDNGGSLSHRYWDDYISVWITIASDFRTFLSGRGLAEEYGDLVAFYVWAGLYLLAKQELMHKGLQEAARSLSRYGKEPLVREMVGRLARGRYIGRIEGTTLRLAVWGSSLLCRLHAYALLALGARALLIAKADERTAASGYAG